MTSRGMTPTTRTPTTRMSAPTTPSAVTSASSTGGALTRCLDPVASEGFLAETWEREPLLVPRADPGRFDDLLALADVERLVCSGELRLPAFRLVRTGDRLDTRDFAVNRPWRPTPFSGMAKVEQV